MRFMVLVKATADSEAGIMPSEQLLPKELVAGFWVWQCASLQEAIEWVKRCPNPMPGDSEIEIRQVFEAEDFGEALSPELREREERLRAQVGKANARSMP